MKCVQYCAFVITMCVVGAYAAPQGERNPNTDVQIVNFSNDNSGIDGYQFAYELSDGQLRQETGTLKDVGEEKVLVVTGAYTFVGPDGKIYWVNYTADENGYHPVVGTGPEGGLKPGQTLV